MCHTSYFNDIVVDRKHTPNIFNFDKKCIFIWNFCRPVCVHGYHEYTHTTLVFVVEGRLNEATRLPCVATRDSGGRDPGG